MAIDPMLYERISGRNADPSKRLGEALAASEKSKAARRVELEKPLGTQVGMGRMWLGIWGVRSVARLIGGLFR